PSIMGTLVPMMSARSMVGNPQLWYAGSAVDQQKHVDGHYFGRVRERALSGKSADRLAFMEWSAPGDSPDGVSDDDLSDPELWAMANPGMGIRISSRHVAAERDALARREFAVERMGVGDWPTAADDRAALDLEAWKAATDAGSSIASGLCLAFDVSPDRSSASICAAGLRDDGIPHIERLPASKAPGPDTLTGTRWLVDRLLQLIEDHDPVAVVCDQRSPAMVFVKQLEDAGVEVRTTSANEHAEACGRLADAVNDRDLRHLGQPELTAAVRGAAKRQLGEAWGWSRRSSQVDISPLVACTLALWGLDRGGEEAPAFYFEVFS
ncbi:MAG: hypothetical protein JWM31_1274, partial [Solirubrobacterales bacterium]|nr:hypothetical protein [Solirubrobacterales bacterium]